MSLLGFAGKTEAKRPACPYVLRPQGHEAVDEAVPHVVHSPVGGEGDEKNLCTYQVGCGSSWGGGRLVGGRSMLEKRLPGDMGQLLALCPARTISCHWCAFKTF